MIPVFQSKTGNERPKRGNCLMSAIASLLELRLSEIPIAPEDCPPDGSWFPMVYNWLRSIGYELNVYHPDVWPGGWGLAHGKSPRGDWDHTVVVFDREIVHDPYPLGGGLRGEPYQYWKITKLEDNSIKGSTTDDTGDGFPDNNSEGL